MTARNGKFGRELAQPAQTSCAQDPLPASVERPQDEPSATDALENAAFANTRQQALELLSTLAPAPSYQRDIAADAAAHRMIGLDAQDTLEEMFATQIIALHSATIDCISKAMLPDQDGVVRREELALATRTSRAFAQLAETMERRRRGGEQKVRVEHVHVHAGGQAVVGTIEQGDRGRPRKSSEQSHAR